jgi:hypothetical protein
MISVGLVNILLKYQAFQNFQHQLDETRAVLGGCAAGACVAFKQWHDHI